ncbi:Ger(x)C family spore germination protein [Paenibacillus piri]|uniref:Ger(X)C family spore germination protein n=1 Tax=Paenibacillus piri TaxID=2547395 RepID=A0A4R5KYZ3_9BACL|nr:Ger(x)C family spore germination protein [Paenibacillus piri]TDG00456.1 Ger(x)C family spore germination protein [Paenibacillus piri]
MKQIAAAFVYLSVLLLLPGCWNSKDIQSMAYVTALGLDYKDGKFHTYVQVLNFTNVAKTETSQLGKNIPVWIGKGVGKTITESFNDIYSTSQIRLFWGHVKAIVCSENILRDAEKIRESYDMLNRYREVRYNILLYGTKVPLQEIFTKKSLMNFSPLDTIMYTPAQMNSQRTFILPVYGYRIISQFNEPSNSSLLPSLTVSKQGWQEDTKIKPMLKVDGAFLLENTQLTGWLSENDLIGYRWMQKKMQRSSINIFDNHEPAAALVLLNPRPKIRPVFEDGNVRFDLSIKLDAYLDELIVDLPKDKIESLAAKVIRDQIIYTYKKGIGLKSDVLKLDRSLYRDHPKEWKALHEKRRFLLDEHSLSHVDVRIHLLHTGKYKGRTY